MIQQSFLQRLYDHIQSHYNIETEELTIVFPNKRAAFYLRSEFQKRCQKTIWLPQMLSIQEAVTQWSKMMLVDNIDMLFELIDIDAALNKEKKSDLSVFGSQAAQMAKDFDEIDQYDINAKDLFNFVLSDKELGIWNFDEEKRREKEEKYLVFFKSLYDYYQRLRERLKAQGKGYYGMLTRQLANLPEEDLLARTEGRKIIFAGFNALTTTEERIIDRLVKNGCAEVIFDYDPHYVNDPNNEAGHFARHHLATHPDWMKKGVADHLSLGEKTIHIVKANGNTLQTKALQEHLQVQTETNAAVILADETLLIPVLNAIPDKEGLDQLKVSMGYPLVKTPIDQLVKTYFKLQRRSRISRKITQKSTKRDVEGWYIWPVIQLMEQEIVKIIFTPNELDTFEQWKKDRLSRGKFIFEDQDIDECTSVADLQQFMRLLFKGIPQSDDIPQTAIDNLKQLIHFISKKIQSTEKDKELHFLLNQVSEIGKTLNRLAKVVERHKNYVRDLDSVEILYRLLSANSTIKLSSSSTDGLQIMGLLETRNLDFKCLHLLSVNEGILPADKQQGSFIPHFIRKAYGLSAYDEKQAVFAYHFYRLMQSGQDIYLYYNSLSDFSGGEASRYILQIRHELKQYPNIKIEEEEFESNAATSLRNIELKVQKTHCIDAVRQYVFKHGLTPTSLSTYLNCPLKFYLKDILGIKDTHFDENMGINDIGTITHEALQRLFEDYKPKDGNLQVIDKELFEKAIMPQCEAKLAESIANNKPYGFSDVGFNYLNGQIIRQQLQNYLSFILGQLRQNSLVVLETEGKLETRLSTPLGECYFWGITDHIDRWGDTYRVVDYKTGKVERKDLVVPVRDEESTDIDFLKTIPEKALQLLIYKYLYLKSHPKIAPEKVRAEIHGLRYANTIVFGLTQNEATDNNDAFLSDATFITDMESLLIAASIELLDAEIPFGQTDDANKCKNCDFREICKR